MWVCAANTASGVAHECRRTLKESRKCHKLAQLDAEHTHTLELPRDDWRQRQLMQETECTERGAVDAKPHAFLCTMIILFVASIQSALLHLYIEECQTRAFVARCHTSVAKAVGEQGFIYASMTSDSSDCFTWLQCRKSIVSFLCEQLGRVGEQTNCIIWKEVMVFA